MRRDVPATDEAMLDDILQMLKGNHRATRLAWLFIDGLTRATKNNK